MTEKNDDFDSFDGLKTIELIGMANSVDIGLSSVIGKRNEQQDTVIADDEYMYYEKGRAIATLCDGMGGLNGGKQASLTCATLLNNTFHKSNNEDVLTFYRRIVPKLDSAVKNLKNEDGSFLNAGTTLISVVVEAGTLNWLSIGDSRIYIIRNNKIKCITHDHNYSMLLNEKVNRGEINQSDADSDPLKDALVSYIGMGGVKYIDINTKPFPLIDEDCIILCSDGLYRALKDDEIVAIVNAVDGDMKQAATALTDFAMSKELKGQDNTSVIVIKYNDFR